MGGGDGRRRWEAEAEVGGGRRDGNAENGGGLCLQVIQALELPNPIPNPNPRPSPSPSPSPSPNHFTDVPLLVAYDVLSMM